MDRRCSSSSGAMAISGLPPLNGFASEWLTFQAFLFGFRGSAEPLILFLFPVARRAAGAHDRARRRVLRQGVRHHASWPCRGARPRPQARESPAVMLVPQALLAALCVALGLFPGAVLRVLGPVRRVPARRATRPADRDVRWASACATDLDASITSMPAAFASRASWAGARRGSLAARRGVSSAACRRGAVAESCSAQTEYTATAFSKPLMMIFGAVYRPTRQVESLSDGLALLPARGPLPRRDRADLRALHLRSACARGPARGRTA